MKKNVILFMAIFAITAISKAQDLKKLEIGDKAPEFSAASADGETWDLKDYLGKQNLVVYFYPAAMTGGCTKQACAYRDFQSDIKSEDALVVGISGDNVEGLKLFKKAHNLNFTLLSDPDGEIANKFGVPIRDGGTISREIDGINYDLVRGATASRWTFVIDKNGKVVYKNDQVDASKDTEEVLNFIKNKI